MSILKEDERIHYSNNLPPQETSRVITVNIQDLPEELLELIVGFLAGKDLDACFDVCRKWRRILNNDKLWKKCCMYPEKYFKLSSREVCNIPKHRGLCKWRRHFLKQKGILENWKRGQFITHKLGIDVSDVYYFMDIVDDHGNHWLFGSGEEGITVWNISDTPSLHSKYTQNDHFGICLLQDKVLTCRSNYVKVFQFKHPEYELKLNYRFKFERSNPLPEYEVVPDDDYVSGVRYIIVDNQFFIGYNENVTGIRPAFLHIWDLNSGCKIATQNVFQQSVVDFIRSAGGSDLTNAFQGGLLLFSGDNRRFLVNLIDDRLKLCHIILFSLVDMRFVKVVARLESRTAWCVMKGDIVVIFHMLQGKGSQISVYNINEDFLAKLDLPCNHNPMINDEFWFDGSKVILKVNNKINVLTVTDSVKVSKNCFQLDKEKYHILKYFDPKFLLLYDIVGELLYSVSVWNIDSGVMLWKLNDVSSLILYQQTLRKSEYPGRMLIYFSGETELSSLNFERILSS